MSPLEAGPVRDGRLTFQETMRMAPLPYRHEPGGIVKRYMSQRAAWAVGCDVPFVPNTAAYGGRK